MLLNPFVVALRSVENIFSTWTDFGKGVERTFQAFPYFAHLIFLLSLPWDRESESYETQTFPT